MTAYSDAETGAMALQGRRVYKACTYVKPDYTDDGKIAWQKAHAADAVNYECEAGEEPQP